MTLGRFLPMWILWTMTRKSTVLPVSGSVDVDLSSARREFIVAHALDGIAQGVGVVADVGVKNHVVLRNAVPL